MENIWTTKNYFFYNRNITLFKSTEFLTKSSLCPIIGVITRLISFKYCIFFMVTRRKGNIGTVDYYFFGDIKVVYQQPYSKSTLFCMWSNIKKSQTKMTGNCLSGKSCPHYLSRAELPCFVFGWTLIVLL